MTNTIDAAFWGSVVTILLLLVFSAFFSGSETALTAASRGKLRAAADKGSKGAARALKVMEDGERLIGSILLGNNVVNILATSLATSVLTKMFGANGVAAATLGMTVLVLIFAEVLPKTLSITNPEAVASRVARPIGFFVALLAPAVTLVRVIVRAILRLFGVTVDPDSQVLAVREEIAGTLEIGRSEGSVEKEDRDIILGALDLADRTVSEVMLHRSAIEMVDAEKDVQTILDKCLKSKYTRLPLYKDDQENIVGVIHAKDFSRAMYAFLEGGQFNTKALSSLDILNVAMPPYFIPETTTLDDQMRAFLKRRSHFALVVDEYGTLQGLVTLEDILEEIVGEISDEFDDEDEVGATRSEDGSYIVEGLTTIRDLNRAHDWQLPDEEANTIAGLVIHEAETIPAEGQVFIFHGFRFEVLERDQNRIAKLKIRPLTLGA